MALETVTLPVAFSGGIDTKTDPKRVVPGKLLLLENGVFTKGKKITKRNGYDILSKNILGGGTLSSSSGLGFFDNEMLQYSSNTLYSWSTQANAWVSKGAIYTVKNSNTSVVRNTYQQSVPDLAINQNISVYAYEDTQSGGVNITVIDVSTGSVIQDNVNVSSSGTTPKAVLINNFIFVLYVSSGNLIARILNIATPQVIGNEITLVIDVNSTYPYFDVINNSSNLLFTYCSSASTNTIKVGYITQDGVVGSVTTGFPNVVSIAETVNNALTLVLEPALGKVIVAYSNNTTGLSYTALNADLTVAQANYSIDSDITTPALRLAPYVVNSTQFGILYEKASSSGNSYDHYVLKRALSIVGGGGSSTTVLRSVGIASKSFQIGSDFFSIVVHDSTLQSTYFVMRQDGVVVSKIMATLAGGLPAKNVLPSVFVDPSNYAYFPAQIKTKFISQNNTTYTLKGISLETIAFSDPDGFISKEISGNLLVAGGVVQSYDGAILSELGFHFFPENITATPSSSGGSMATGVYQYFVVYAWVDRQGQIHRSASSIGYQVSVTGPSGSVVHTVPTLRVTGKSNVIVEVYRTIANGTQAYKLTSVSSPIYNSTTSDTVSFTDTASDASIQSNEILYTSGNVLDNDSPTSASILDVNKNRALLAGLEDPLTFAYSKQSLPGSGIAFSAEFTFRVDPTGGAIKAIKFMDDKIVIFKKSYAFYVSGEGPDDTGNNNDFSQPILISSDVGCPFPKSCVLTPMGLMFMSTKGIYLIDRSLNCQYIGADVEAYNGSTIVDATLMEDKNQVRFLTSSNVALVFDYFFNQWSIFTNHGGSGAGLWKQTTYVYSKADGQVYQENPSSYQDGSLAYPLRIGTSWLKLTGLQNYQRVRRAYILGDFYSNHRLRVQVAYDYEPFFSSSYVFNATSLFGVSTYGQSGVNYGDDSVYGGARSAVYQFKIYLDRQKCEAIQFLFDDIQNPTSGPAYSLSDLSLEVGIKTGMMKLPVSKKVGG